MSVSTQPALFPVAIADFTCRFPVDPGSGRVGLALFPTAQRDQLVHSAPKPAVVGSPPPVSAFESLVQVKVVGDAEAPWFAQGHTMRNTPTANAFVLAGQCSAPRGTDGRNVVCTTLHRPATGHRIEHRLAWRDGDAAVEISTEFHNDSDRPVTLEMLSSFSLGGITPFATADATGRLRVHRFRSGWSAEGRLVTETIEALHLEPSWSGAGAYSERFGQVGTMPVRRWFPFVAVEDTVAGVCWGAQLAWAGSWQMEVFRQHDAVCLSGGLADREFGHWTRTLAPGESLLTPPAVVTCVAGTLDDLCDRLTAMQQPAADAQPAVEADLPIVFNEFCTTWGNPRHDHLVAIADRLRGTPVRYLVIDAGWYKPVVGGDWDGSHGDWAPNPELFPHGIEAAAAAIRERGLLPGLWFELETVGEHSAAFRLTDHLLQRDGHPVTVRGRRFWDLNDPWVLDYLAERVTGRLESGGFDYLKVDYNETLGLGCENHGAESLGEGLRRQVEGTHRFFESLRARLPGLVIENCASGGHRLEPSMLGRTAMSSFSDAHETVEIPIIAAGLHRLMLPRQSQIWAVLHRVDSDKRLAYSLAATFLGRMCLSGEVEELTESQWEIVRAAMDLYGRVAPIIKHGTSRHFGDRGESWRHPRGWQAVVRMAADGREALVVIHTFADAPARLEFPLPASGDGWTVRERFPAPASVEVLEGNRLAWSAPGDFEAAVLRLKIGQPDPGGVAR